MSGETSPDGTTIGRPRGERLVAMKAGEGNAQSEGMTAVTIGKGSAGTMPELRTENQNSSRGQCKDCPNPSIPHPIHTLNLTQHAG